jgi:Tfp pilus assembly protein PilZ
MHAHHPSTTPPGARRSIRRAISIACEVICERADAPIGYRATELSARGIWLQTCDPIRAGENVVVCFRPDDKDEREVCVFAQVARVTTARGATDDTLGVGMGLELLDLTIVEEQRILRWLEHNREPIARRRRPIPRARASEANLTSCWR